MKEGIKKLGARKAVALCVGVSVGFSVSAALIVHFVSVLLTGKQGDIVLAILMSSLIPAVVSPFIFTPIIRLMLHAYALEDQLQHQATYDALTGLLNRQKFLEFSDILFKKACQLNKSMCLLYIDIDRFKGINDQYGHMCGDLALSTLGGLLRSSCRSGDLICRMGGDEIAVLLYDVSLAAGIQYAERLQAGIADTTIMFNNVPVEFTVSIGLNELLPDDDLFGALKKADMALYTAKRQGRNRFEVYPETMPEAGAR